IGRDQAGQLATDAGANTGVSGVLDGSSSGAGSVEGSTSTGAVAARGSTAAGSSTSPAGSPGSVAAAQPSAAGKSYDQLLREQLASFTSPWNCTDAKLTATDRGVTDKEIKLGWLIPNLNELRAAGFDVGLAGDWDKIITAWVNELNRLKMGCRKITFVKEIFDVLSVDDMLAKCRAMINDHKVFAVFTPGGYDSVAQLCVAKDGKTPFINPEPEPEGWYRQAAPYLWNMLMTKDRMHRNHIRWLAESNTLKKSHTIGVVYHDIPNVGPSVRNGMLTELRKQGFTPKRVVALSSDDEQAVAQINQVVVQFQQEGINFVLMPMNLIFKSQFQQQAEKQSYFPEYTDSDHYFGCFDFVTTAYSAASWDRTKCVSAVDIAGFRTKDALELAKNHPYAKYADQVYLRTYKESYDNNGESSEDTANTQRALFRGTGEQVLLFKQAADRVGVDLTRPKWGASMGQTGAYCTIVRFNCLTFGPQKWDAPNDITVVQWHAEPGDGYEERRYRQIIKAFPAYY
ncbi:MAG: hypothetical protein ACRDKJ_10035, partial [Actinomycetota bacterium]